MAPCCSWAPCSRPRRIDSSQARDSRTRRRYRHRLGVEPRQPRQSRQSQRQDRPLDVRRRRLDEESRSAAASLRGDMSATFDNYIAGEWVGGADTAANRNPSDLADVIGEYTMADAEQTRAAVAAAKTSVCGVVGEPDSAARRYPRRCRIGNPGEKGRDRAAARARRREDPGRRRRRDGARRPDFQVLCRRGAATLGRKAAFGSPGCRRGNHA